MTVASSEMPGETSVPVRTWATDPVSVSYPLMKPYSGDARYNRSSGLPSEGHMFRDGPGFRDASPSSTRPTEARSSPFRPRKPIRSKRDCEIKRARRVSDPTASKNYDGCSVIYARAIMSPQERTDPVRLLQVGGLVRFLLEAPLRVILVVAGVALVLAAGGLKIPGRFEPDVMGRKFMGGVGIVLLVTGLLVHFAPLAPGDGGATETPTSSPTATAEVTLAQTVTAGTSSDSSASRTDTSTLRQTHTDTQPDARTTASTEPPIPSDADGLLSSGAVYQQGERLWFRVPDEYEGGFLEIRTVEGGTPGTFVKEFAVDADGEAIIDTSDLLGEYVVYDPERRTPLRIDSNGMAGRTSNTTSAAWEVAAES